MDKVYVIYSLEFTEDSSFFDKFNFFKSLNKAIECYQELCKSKAKRFKSENCQDITDTSIYDNDYLLCPNSKLLRVFEFMGIPDVLLAEIKLNN